VDVVDTLETGGVETDEDDEVTTALEELDGVDVTMGVEVVTILDVDAGLLERTT